MFDFTRDKHNFDDIDPSNISIIPLEKIIDKRGFIYIVFDSSFPDFIKIGRTGNLKKRIYQYNQDRPYKSAKFMHCSKPFSNCHEVEIAILKKLYESTEPSTFSKEWFKYEYIEYMKSLIIKAEEFFDILDESQYTTGGYVGDDDE